MMPSPLWSCWNSEDNMRFLKISFVISLILGCIVGGFTLYVALSHNPQGEFVDFETGVINYFGLGAIFIGWALVTLILVYALLILAFFLQKFTVGIFNFLSWASGKSE